MSETGKTEATSTTPETTSATGVPGDLALQVAQTFDLYKRASAIRQGTGSVEDCWNRLQDAWVSIDTKDPNPMRCPADIRLYNQKIQVFRLYQFLMAIGDQFEQEKKGYSQARSAAIS